ncbi:hypothetical protein RIF29_35132 [Crotalaria pallida]|uniref:Uncharacterized protein n=1 Tax=Crotalaria pallida TaxID=3830 RepID=A0AAN9HRK1_CROPI
MGGYKFNKANHHSRFANKCLGPIEIEIWRGKTTLFLLRSKRRSEKLIKKKVTIEKSNRHTQLSVHLSLSLFLSPKHPGHHLLVAMFSDLSCLCRLHKTMCFFCCRDIPSAK